VLTERLRAVVGGEPTTESELRTLWESADGWARTLEAQISGSERRLQRLDRLEAPPLAEVSRELRRIESLRPQLTDVRGLLAELEQRARELRAAWLMESLGRRSLG
jgi:hypothetical protein